LPIELNYKATFKHPYGEEVVHSKTASGPASNGPLVDLPFGSSITVIVEVT
jgi:hypothetical protein